MRITKISLKNFQAFYAEHDIDLGRNGQNLLIYGENGSGKSSLLKAIELFLDSHVRNLNFNHYRNFFAADTDGGHVKISARANENEPETTFEWSNASRTTDDSIILDAAKTKGVLDYKALLEVYFLHPEDCEVNIFNLLVNTILANSRNEFTQNRLIEDWEAIKQMPIPRQNHNKKIQDYQSTLDNFNQGLQAILNQLQQELGDILQKFRYPISLEFDFQGVTLNISEKRIDNQSVLLKINFYDRHFPLAHQFLNEAKLSAIALSIYLASLQINPSSELKILVLDDVLIGLDMSNRLPVIDILQEEFSDYQIFLMTYDKEWYDILKRNFSNWKAIELYAGRGEDYEIPVILQNQRYLEKARFYLAIHDHKAAAIYLRTAFEVKIKWFCEKKNIPVKYREKPKDLTSNDFWEPIKNAKDQNGNPKYIDANLAAGVELYRSLVMNPLSHARLVNVSRQEIENAINTIENLENLLDQLGRRSQQP
ncbi:AAA family ATPase [Phormidium sp. FACHB-1136]|uniref:AAA family ATPase n=1 Tax=Phormidium sp. FACHB-1136 TaxID=2692848 RepID=UPI001688F11E|nr:AAA family ATPase [Phormidium sp. FACHB-1136]MBD2425734.1 AAA family ATPase [Phormidium sp. FACHB-1136]